MTKRSLEQIEESLRTKLAEAGSRDADHDGIPDDEERSPMLTRGWGGTRDDPVIQIAPPLPGGGGGRSSSGSGAGRGSSGGPQVWRRGSEPIAPPATPVKPSVPNVWRKGEAPPKPPETAIGSQVGKTPKKKLDEPVDLAKEFEKTKPAVKKEKPAASSELSADKRDRMGRKEPSMTQNKEPELRADRRVDRVVEPSDDSSAPTWGGRVIGGVGTAGALGGAAYLWNKYKDEQNKAEKEKAYKEIYGPDAEMPAPREKPAVREPADPNNPDYENLKEATTTQNNFLQEDRQDPRQVIEKYLGKRMSNSEYSAFLRAVGAESGSQPLERAHIASVILNRAKAAQGDVIGVLNTPSQFQAITGPKGNQGTVFKPYYNGARNIIPGIDQEIAGTLELVKPGLTHFSAADPAAYKDVGGMKKYRSVMKMYTTDPSRSRVYSSVFGNLGPVPYNPNDNTMVRQEKKLGDKFRDPYADLVTPTKLAQVQPSGAAAKPKKNKEKDKDKEKELTDRLARELAVSKQLDRPVGGSAKPTPVKPEATPAKPEVTPTQTADNNKSVDTKTKTHPTGTYVQPDWSKYSYGDLGPLKKDKNGVWKTEDGKQTATDPKLIADLEKLSPAKEPSIIDKAVASLPSFLGGKDASAKTEPTPTPTATKNDAKQTKDAAPASDVERGKALDKIIRGVAGDLSGATAADKRDEYYRQQLEKAKQEKAERDKIEASKAEKKPQEPAKKAKAKKAKSTKKADQPRGGSALASAEREPDTVTIVPAPPSPVAPPPVADKIDVKDLTTDQAGLAAAKTDTKVDQNAELVARKQAEENQRRQEAERKAAEARAQAEADRLAAQARAQQELEANRQAEIERAKKAAPIQQTAQQDSGSGFKNMWDKGIEAFTGKQRVNLRDPRITLPESINTELEEILRLAGKKTKE